MAIGDIIVGIDIGTSKVCTVLGEVNNFGQIETICSTSCKCSGLKKGKIINEDEVTISIAKTIQEAEDEANLKINSAYTTISGKYVTIVQNNIVKEVKDKGIKVLDVYPGGVDTSFRANKRQDYLRPETIAKHIVYAIENNDDGMIQEIVCRPIVESNY